MERRLVITRRFAFALEILVLFVLQGTPRLLPPILGNTPSLLICAALTIAIAESELCATFFGLACGVLTDLGFTDRVGFFAVTLTVICFFISFFTKNIFVTSLQNTLLFSALIITVLFSLHFLIFHMMLLRTPAGYFLRHHLIRIVYTLVFIPPIYGLYKFLRRKT